jgi:hypothetical protein
MVIPQAQRLCDPGVFGWELIRPEQGAKKQAKAA